MSGDVSHVTLCLTANIEAQIEQRRQGKRKLVRHGGALCCHCLQNPPNSPDRYCAGCRKAYSAKHKRDERQELKRLRALEQQLSKGKDNGQEKKESGATAGGG